MTARPEDRRAAAKLGFMHGLSLPLDAHANTVNRSASDALDGPLNAIAVAYGHELYGFVDEVDADQLVVLQRYLQELASAASAGIRTAMNFRQGYVEATRREPPRNAAEAWLGDDDVIDAFLRVHDIDVIEDRAKKAGRPLTKTESSEIRRLGRGNKRAFDRVEALVRAAGQNPTAPVALGPRPAAAAAVTPRAAEELCATWLRHFGAHDAEVTRYSADGGLDVISYAKRLGAQVKNYTGSVSVQEVRQLVGVCAVMNLQPVFMTSGTYTKAAQMFARQADVMLYKYDVQMGTCHRV